MPVHCMTLSKHILMKGEIVEEVPRLYNVSPLKISKKLFNKAVAEKAVSMEMQNVI